MMRGLKVFMSLQPRDYENAEYIRRHFGLANKAGAVSCALSMAKALYEAEEQGSDIVIISPDGSEQQLHLPR